MKRIIISALALLWSASAHADMYENSSNAKQPDAINNLTKNGIPAAGGPIVLTTGGSINLSASTVSPALTQSPGSMAGFPSTGADRWWVPGWWGAPPPGTRGGQNTQFLFGSYAAPITTAGSPVAIGIVQAKTAATCDGNSANTGCNSALLVQNMGLPAATMTTNGITAYAETQSTSGVGIANAQAGNFVSTASLNAQTGALGLYAVGRRLGVNGFAFGAEISAANETTTDCGPMQYYRLGGCESLYVGARGLANISGQIHIARGSLTSLAREGITIDNGTVSEKTINDHSESDTVLNISGTHIHGIFIEAPSVEEQVSPPAPAPTHTNNSVTTNSFNDLSNSLRSIHIAGAHADAAIWVRPNAGFFGLNIGVAPEALFHMGGTISRPYTAEGSLIQQASGGVTDTSSSGVVPGHKPVNLLKGTPLLATNPTTYTVAETLHVGEPVASTNVTFLNKYAITTSGAVHVDTSLGVGPSFPVLAAGEIGLSKITASASAPGNTGGKIAFVCGTAAGSGKLIAYGGTSATAVTIVDNIGAGITGC